MALLWDFDDQQAIKPISENNEQKWSQLATEVQFIKLKELMGKDFYHDVKNNPTGTWNKKLIDGDSYTVGGVSYTFAGLQYVLSFLLYSRYIVEINAQDTFAGLMQNDNENASHVGFAQKKNMADKMDELAREHWNDCYDFVCENSAEFPYANFKTSGKIYYI